MSKKSAPRTLRRKQAPPAFHARLAQVPLDYIRVPPEMLGPLEALKPLPSFVVSEQVGEVLSLLRPPLLTKDPSDAGYYVLLANARVLQWHQRRAEAASAGSQTVRCLILAGDLTRMAALGEIEAHLLPMVLGEASVREAREARKALKRAGVVRPRTISARDRLQQNLARRQDD